MEESEVLNGLFDFLRPKIGDSAIRDWFSDVKIVNKGKSSFDLLLPNAFLLNWVKNNYTSLIEEAGRKFKIFFTISLNDSNEQVANESDLEVSKVNNHMFNPDFSFDNFIVGKPNQMAFESASRIARSEEIIFNPLFIHGDVGLGKTHLMNAIGNYRQKHFPNKKTGYFSAEQFMNLFIKSLQNRNTLDFRDEFRSLDMLLIDDFQFLGSKEATQEEFFHTLNTLLDQKKQLVISADKHPSSLPGVASRLKSRLGWGLVVDVHPANYELRLGILDSKSKAMGVQVPGEVLEYIANAVDSSIRELEGALTKIIKYSEWMHVKMDLELAKNLIASSVPKSSHGPEKFLNEIAKILEFDVETLKSAKRSRDVVRARQKTVYLLRHKKNLSFVQIARMLGNKDHSSIMYADTQAKKLKEKDPVFAADLKNLVEKLS